MFTVLPKKTKYQFLMMVDQRFLVKGTLFSIAVMIIWIEPTKTDGTFSDEGVNQKIIKLKLRWIQLSFFLFQIDKDQ